MIINVKTAPPTLPGATKRYEARHARDDDKRDALAVCELWDADPSGDLPARIGAYEARTQPSGFALLSRVCDDLARRGAASVVGPVNGSTWQRYRFITDRGDRAAFLLEPDNPDRYPLDWRAAGFKTTAEYLSAFCGDTSRADPRLSRVRARMRDIGVTIRPLEIDRFENELESIHALSLVAFAKNFLYSPIDASGFKRMYLPFREHVTPELVRIAELDGRTVGYVFALTDARATPPTLIVKTVAVAPGRAYAGLGQLLVEDTQHAAHRAGIPHAIHALMHDDNLSTRLSSHYATPFRRYALFEKRLTR